MLSSRFLGSLQTAKWSLRRSIIDLSLAVTQLVRLDIIRVRSKFSIPLRVCTLDFSHDIHLRPNAYDEIGYLIAEYYRDNMQRFLWGNSCTKFLPQSVQTHESFSFPTGGVTLCRIQQIPFLGVFLILTAESTILSSIIFLQLRVSTTFVTVCGREAVAPPAEIPVR